MKEYVGNPAVVHHLGQSIRTEQDQIVCANYEQSPMGKKMAMTDYMGPQDHPANPPLPTYQAVIPLQSLPGATGVIYLASLFAVFGVRPIWILPIALLLTLAIHTAFYKMLKVPLPWGLLQGFIW